MKLEVRSDTHTKVDLTEVTEAVESGLSRFRERLTHVSVHLSDANGPKGGADARCALEARAAGRQPVAVTSEGVAPQQAVKSAIDKMQSLLTTTFGRESDHRGGTSASGQRT